MAEQKLYNLKYLSGKRHYNVTDDYLQNTEQKPPEKHTENSDSEQIRWSLSIREKRFKLSVSIKFPLTLQTHKCLSAV